MASLLSKFFKAHLVFHGLIMGTIDCTNTEALVNYGLFIMAVLFASVLANYAIKLRFSKYPGYVYC
jgi:hypothetical protein